MDQTNPTTPSGHSCRRCGWPRPKPHPSPKRGRDHKRICGTLEGYTDKVIEHSGSDSDKEKTPSLKIEKRIIKEGSSSAGGVEEKTNRSEDDMFSAATEFSETGISSCVTSEVKKMDERSEVFESPMIHSKDADKVQENETKCSVPWSKIITIYGSHKDKVIDQMEHSDTVQDQGEDVHAVSVTSHMPLAETLIEDFKDYKTVYFSVLSDDKHVEKRPVVDIFEVKTMQENVHESQPSNPAVVIEGAKVANSADNEAEASGDKHLTMTLGELIESEIRQAEIDLKAKGKMWKVWFQVQKIVSKLEDLKLW